MEINKRKERQMTSTIQHAVGLLPIVFMSALIECPKKP
jgi:hypothetical protein